MRKIRRVSWTAQLMAVLFCTGCGAQTAQDIPKLIEPVAINSAYRTVEYGDIGSTKILLGTVVPTDYCHFYATNVTVSEIVVEVGDYVEAGDILAYADVAFAEEELSELQSELAQENEVYDINCRITETKLAQLEWRKQESTREDNKAEPDVEEPDITDDGMEEGNITAEGMEETDMADDSIEEADITAEDIEEAGMADDGMAEQDIENEIQVEQENARYDSLLHQYRVDKLSTAIAQKQEIITNGTLRARHAGYVTYTKNIAVNREAGGNENIVIVSDLEDTYIELSDTTVNSYLYADYEVKYLRAAGEELEVTEIPYSSEELILAKAGGRYPNVRLTCPAAEKLTIGENYPIYYKKKNVQNVLIVGNDSIYSEDDSSFVYVQSDTGEKERRDIVLGAQDSNYTEVVSGLSEGEKVYYESKESMPVNYDKYTVELSDFEVKNYSNTYNLSNAFGFPCMSEYEGTIVEIAVEKEQKIQAGDLLCVINTGEGKAAITEAQNNISHENTSYAARNKSYEEQIAALTNDPFRSTDTDYEIQILNYEKELASVEHAYRLGQLQKVQESMEEGNDGAGNVSVYAKTAGTVSKISISEGDKVGRGDNLLSISTTSSNMLLVQLAPMKDVTTYAENADIGEKVTMEVKENTYTGTCVGWTVSAINEEKVYLYSDESGAHLSYSSSSGYEYPAFFVQMEEDSFYEDMPRGTFSFSYLNIKDAFVLPSNLIYMEKKEESANKSYYYVWRVEEGELVKQYILLDETLSSGGMRVVLSGVEVGDELAMEY